MNENRIEKKRGETVLWGIVPPWGYVLNGEMAWQGEWEHDTGTIVLEKNVITVLKADPLS